MDPAAGPVGGPSISIADHDEEEAAQAQAPAPQPPAEGAPGSPPPAAAYKKPAKGGTEARKGISWLWTGRLRMLKIAGVALIVLLAAVGGYIFYLQSQTGLESIVLVTPTETEDGLLVQVATTSAGAEDFSGDADISIYYNDGGGQVYTGKVPIGDKGIGEVVVPYGDFLTGPGNYDIVVSAEGESDTVIYNCGRIVTDVHFWNWAENESGGKELRLNNTRAIYDEENETHVVDMFVMFAINDAAGALPGTRIGVRLQREGGTPDTTERNVANRTSFNEHLDYDGPGNYSITVTVTNPVKSSSEYRTVEEGLPEPILLNAAPVADAGEDKEEDRSGLPPKATVTFTGSAIDEEGLGDEAFVWYFADDDTTETGRTVQHEYDNAGEYIVTLIVTDSYKYAGQDDVIVVIT